MVLAIVTNAGVTFNILTNLECLNVVVGGEEGTLKHTHGMQLAMSSSCCACVYTGWKQKWFCDCNRTPCAVLWT
jgi:hypothetical protein